MSRPAKRARIVYAQHVDWRWIKQRPQFLAELLGARYDVRVVHRVHPHRFRYPENRSGLRRLPLLPLPSGLGRAWGGLTAGLQRVWTRVFAGRRPEVLWVTFPSVWTAIPRSYRDDAIVVYDCMDDALAFAADPGRRDAIARAERELVERAALVFCSSEALRRALVARYGHGVSSKLRVVRNGLAQRLLDGFDGAERPATAGGRASAPRLAYIGTIAEWLDVDVLHAALDAVPTLEIDLYGPVEGERVTHERLHYRGVVAHEQLREISAGYDALVMPFRVTELIKSVDPVKLYEYLSFERPVITVRYPEVERFAPLVNFYSDAASFVALVRALGAGQVAAPSRDAVRSFLVDNTWDRRAEAVATELDRILAGASPA